ncbi:aminotransferase class I/II-fold pyridoxal phosphate-dependent enzyme [Epidermidibacterium keratini]|uniref:homocysteine desulfhydrase n=1 Tax=Epidermidibacterium keratini TaxID=1891644 RepID=A0A7L4YP76_9ACTN|nr:aminotransferase class I/II-fold pyridoxal phosphate-dependent enzyme [Epidermidibacterium keratini]QHC00609.1 aminotransferase class I/II-fold pyridoxal phosphate-dependent enzyme [Epidermidibacterium keratini]
MSNLGPVVRRGFATEQIHGAELATPTSGVPTPHGSRIPPIHLTAGFVFDDVDQAQARFRGEDDGYVYTRMGNPTNADVEARIAGLEGGKSALLLATGQAATSVATLGIVGAGDHIVASGHLYEGTRGFFQDNLGRLGVSVDFVDDPTDLTAWAAAIRPETRLLFAESISNPTAIVLDIAAIARIAERNAIPLVVDNTLATPYLLRPLEHGAHIVVHSASKFLSGHGQALGGVVVDGGSFDWSRGDRFRHLTEPDRALGGASFVERFGSGAFTAYTRGVVAGRFGPSPSPFNAFLVRQGIETLSLRMERHCANALAIATWLQKQPEVSLVRYPGLDGQSPVRVRRYLPRGAGSVFSFELRGGAPAAADFIHSLTLFSHMSHLGDVRSLVLHPESTSHVARSEAERHAVGITPGLVRLSVGIEDVSDLIADLDRGLDALHTSAATTSLRSAPAVQIA